MKCMECGAEMRCTDELFFESFQKESFEIRGVLHYVCDFCGEIELDASAMSESRKQADLLYRERHGLLTPEKIRGIRKNLGLSQKDFEIMLGLSSPTVSRWETGSVVQPKAMDNYLRIVGAHDCVAQDLIEHAETGSRPRTSIRHCAAWTTKAPA